MDIYLQTNDDTDTNTDMDQEKRKRNPGQEDNDMTDDETGGTSM